MQATGAQGAHITVYLSRRSYHLLVLKDPHKLAIQTSFSWLSHMIEPVDLRVVILQHKKPCREPYDQIYYNIRDFIY